MKKLTSCARHCVWLFLVFSIAALGQETDPFPNYVVIGAFAHRENAVSFTADAKQHKFPAQFEMNSNRKLYYVYVLTTADRDVAVAEATRLRAETKYFDTWVYAGGFNVLQRAQGTNTSAADIDPVTGALLESIPATDSAQIDTEGETADHRKSPSGEDDTGNSTGLDPAVDSVTSAVAIPAPKRVTALPLQTEDVVGKNFYFYLFRGDNGNTIAGEVDAIDFIQSRKMATYPANEPVSVRMPSGNSKHITFICQVFGYRKQQREYDPAAPDPDLYLDDKGDIVVPFELVRLQKGDIAVMYNVFFFKDAAVMRPESRYEVNNLLELLQENPSYKIRIHGHTNGNAGGKIIRMNTPGNFYSLTGTKQGFGSAKKLSEERAMVMKAFLMHNGIAEDRMTIKAWGGKKPLHDPKSARAIENVRVEIEILSE